MGSPKDPCFKPNNPFLSFIPTTTTSTTAAPDIDYFVLPNSGAPCPPNIDCNTCGYFVFPIGDKYSKYNDGSRIRIIKENDNYIDKPLVHNKNAIINNSEKLITSTETISGSSPVQQSIPNLLLSFENDLQNDGATTGPSLLPYPDLSSVISNEQSKFGNYSAKITNGQFIYSNSNSFFAFGTDDFVIETWLYQSDWSDGAVTLYDGFNLDSQDPGRPDCFYWQLYKDSYSYFLTVTPDQNTSLIYYNGTQYWFNSPSGYTIPLNTWVKHSLIRQNGHFYWYVNDSLVGSTLVDPWDPRIFDGINENLPLLNITSEYSTIGNIRDNFGMNPLNGYLDEFKITLGQFTTTTTTTIPPTSPEVAIKEIYLYINDLFVGSSKINYDSEKSFAVVGGNQYWLDTNILLKNNETCIISSSGTYDYFSNYKGGSLFNVILGKRIECDGGIITPDGRQGECDGCSFDINLPAQSLIGRFRNANYYTQLGQDMLDVNVNFTNSDANYTKPFLVGSKKILTNSYFPSGYLQLRPNDACVRYSNFSTPFYTSISKIQNNTPNNFSINNVIKATIKIKDTDIIIAQKYIGSPNSQLVLSRNNILNKPAIIFDGCDIVNKNIDLSNQKIVVELSSICESINSQTANKCCDQLPSLSLTNNKSNIVCNLPPLSVLYYNPFTNVNQNNFNNLIYTDNISLTNPYFASSWSSNQQFNINTNVLSINQVNDSNNIYDFYINTRSNITSSGFLSLEYIRFWNKTTSTIPENYTISIYDSDSYPFDSYIKDNFIGSGTISNNGEISNLIPSNHTLPLYTQYFNQYAITAGKSYLIRIQIDKGTPNSTISIDDFTLYGYYLNTDQYKFVTYKPTQPTNLVATAYNGYVTLDWDASQFDGYINTIQYFVEYSLDNGSTWSVYNESFTGTSATINNLTNGSSYIFRVRSLSEFNNYSDYSQISKPVIPLLITNSLSQPQNLNGTAGDQKVTLYWDAPVLNTGGTITDYLIQYSINNGQDWIIYTDSISSNTSATINNLQNNINYIFRVAAKNNNGYGPFSQSSIAIKPSPNVSNKLGIPTVNFPPDVLDGVSINEAIREEGIFSIKGTINSLISLEFTNILTNTKITKLIGSNGKNQPVILSPQEFNSLLSNFPIGEIILNIKQIDINNILLDSDISSYNLRFILNTTTTTTTTTPPSFTIPKNGDFELGEDGIIGYGGGHATYWSYSDVNILSLSSYPEFSNDPRNRFVDLHYKKKGYIEQVIPTISGYTYTIQFKLGANNVDERDIVKLLKASANNQYSYYNFIPSPNYGSYNQIGWQTKTFTFTASGLTTNLRFESDCNLCKNYGPAIDDIKLISVVPPPPPPTTTTTTLLPTTTTTTTTTLAPICCDWDGNYRFIYETVVSGTKYSINEPLYFIPTRFADQLYPFNIWETYKELPCGDIFYGVISCNTSLPQNECLEKWNFDIYQLTCGNNYSYANLLINGYVEPCSCNSPPIFKFIGTNTENCNCQPPPCYCSQTWDLSDCVERTISPRYLDDGKLPDGPFPETLTLEIPKVIYVANILYLYDSDTNSWKSTNDTLTIDYYGLYNFIYNNESISQKPFVRYRELYNDYTIADSSNKAFSLSFSESGGVGTTSNTFSFVDYENILYFNFSSSSPNITLSITKLDETEYITIDNTYGANFFINKPLGEQSIIVTVISVDAEWSYIISAQSIPISYGSTCRSPEPIENCFTCTNSPSVDYTTLPSYPSYISDCTGRPIDIDIDACNGEIRPKSFSKPNIVLYYEGGPNKPFLVIDNIAYDTRDTGLIKIFTTSDTATMRDMVCNRVRFATLTDETKLNININLALTSNWPYNDLYWHSSCENLPNEVPVNLIPC